jgi:hypothetical protein
MQFSAGERVCFMPENPGALIDAGGIAAVSALQQLSIVIF